MLLTFATLGRVIAMNLIDYITQKSGKTMRALALDMGYSVSTLSRQFRAENALTLETLRDISLATDLDFLDLAIRAELITETHAKAIRAKGSLLNASNGELLNELKRRLDQGEDLNEEAPIFATHEEMARAELAEELKKADVDLAAYRETEGDEVDYDSIY